MLLGIRERAQSWFMWVIIILIIIPFALWGIQEYIGNPADVVVAEVGGREMSQREFEDAYQRQRSRLQAIFGGSIDFNNLEDGRLKKEALKGLIDEEVLLQSAVAGGLRIGDEQIVRAIRAQEPFQRDGRFAQEKYDAWLRNQGYSPGGFEQQFRRALINEQVQAGVAQSALVTERDIDDILRLEGQSRDFSYLEIQASDAGAEITDAQLQAYYDQHRDSFMEAEQVNLSYLELSRDDLADAIEISEEELMQRYEEQRANFTQPEQRRASHILLSVEEGADETDIQAQAQALKARLDAGEDFAALAGEYSQDPGSAANGGDLGYFGRNVMTPAFEDAVFALNQGETSDPIRTEFGFHIIRLTGINAGGSKPFEAVREQLLRDLKREMAEQSLFEQAEQLANLSFENPETLEVAAEALELEIRETGFFDRSGGAGLAAEPKVLDAAFREEVLQGNNSDVLELKGDRIVVARVKEHRQARQRSLDEVHEQVLDRVRQEARRAAAEKLGTSLVARLRDGADSEALAAEQGLAWKRHEGVKRIDGGMPPAVRDLVFRIGRPAEGASLYAGSGQPGGGYVVVSLSRVQDGAPVASDKAARDAVRQRLNQSRTNAGLAAHIADLKARSVIVVYEDRL